MAQFTAYLFQPSGRTSKQKQIETHRLDGFLSRFAAVLSFSVSVAQVLFGLSRHAYSAKLKSILSVKATLD